jgi:hypothetical protein
LVYVLTRVLAIDVIFEAAFMQMSSDREAPRLDGSDDAEMEGLWSKISVDSYSI